MSLLLNLHELKFIAGKTRKKEQQFLIFYRVLMFGKFLAFVLVSISLTGWRAPLSVAQTRETCMECHSDNSLTMTRNKKEVSLYVEDRILQHSTHKKLNCIACHTGFDPYEVPHKAKITPVNCLSCHNKALLKHPFHPNMVRAMGVDGAADVSCKGCHGRHDVVSPKTEGSRWHVKNLVQSCGSCHGTVTEHFLQSAHGQALAAGVPEAPNCLKCHMGDVARVHAGQDSVQLKIAQEKMCISCHIENPSVAGKAVRGSKFIASYEKSIHGAALLRGNASAANCVNCHGSHEMNRSFVPTSRVNKLNVQEVCAQCHASIVESYASSVHAEALHKGNMDSPVCTDCHGEHDILKHTDPKSPVSSKNVSQQVCGTCHASLKLTRKYGLSTDRFQTFSDSYHGLAVRGGAIEVVNCASCHGAHDIRRSHDSTSSVSKENIARTCGKCHPGANTRFALGSVHVSTAVKEEDPVLYWIATIYIWLIVGLIGGMAVHNGADFVKKIRRKLLIQQGLLIEEPVRHRMYLRMTLNERLQHAALLTSFVTLVLTGFMLRYPEAWWVAGIRSLSDNVFELRSWLHRIAGVVMVTASVYHVGYLSFTARGRQLFKDLLPALQDFSDVLNVLRFNFGVLREKPKFGRFGYVEKSEYWALVWGTVLMTLTGAMMWFENTTMSIFGKLAWDIARTVHFYEAVLATLAIVVWHFYFVIFNPDVYPMSLAWLTGKISEKDMEEEHPLELEQMRVRELQEAERREEALKETHEEDRPS